MIADTQRDAMLHAETMAAHWLALGNAASERGENELAERHYERSQKWLDKANVMAGLA